MLLSSGGPSWLPPSPLIPILVAIELHAQCPACGATVVFTLGATLLKVCEHCGVAVARKGANVAAYETMRSAAFPKPAVETLLAAFTSL